MDIIMKTISKIAAFILVLILLTTTVSCNTDIGASSGTGGQQISLTSNNSITNSPANTELSGESESNAVSSELSEEMSNDNSSEESELIEDNSKETESMIDETSNSPNKKIVTEISARYDGVYLPIGSEINKSDIVATLTYKDGTTEITSEITLSPLNVTREGSNKITVTSGSHETEITIRAYDPTEIPSVTKLTAEYTGGTLKNYNNIDKSKIKATLHLSDGTTKAVTDFTFGCFEPLGSCLVYYDVYIAQCNIPLESKIKQQFTKGSTLYYLRDDSKAVITYIESINNNSEVIPDEIAGHIVAEVGGIFEFKGETILIPSTIERIVPGSFFLNNSNCKSITVDSKNLYYTSEDGVLYNKDKTVLVRYPVAKEGSSFTIPKSVITIDHSAFAYCKNLQEIIIPDGVKVVGTSAFMGIKLDTQAGLKITGGINIEKIGTSAFSSSSLKEITFSNKLIEIGNNAFSSTAIKSIVLPDSLKFIGASAFGGCYSLESVTLGKQTTNIKQFAFNECKALKTINFPSTLKSIGSQAFGACASLEKVTLPSSLIEIGSCAFSGSGLKEIIIGDSVNKLDYGVFANCKSLTKVTLGKGINRIKDGLFSNCSALTDIIFTGEIFYIDKQSFYNCSSLQNIDIPVSIMVIGKDAFIGCISLSKLDLPAGVIQYNKY
ncbi:MAG: leucine-rich repeat protein [Eubacteriales bacterium]|nr:leucine-rich repeat protein [Eubacteriales bacterium]